MKINNKVIVNKGLFNNIDIMENTLESFTNALAKDYIIRFSVIHLIDNNFIIFDETAMIRLFNVKDSIKKFNYEDLSYISPFNILKLSDIKDIIKGKQIIVYVQETKKNILHLLNKELENLEAHIIIESDSLKVLKFFAHKHYEVSLYINKKNKGKLNSSFKPNMYNIEINLFDNKKIKVLRENSLVIGSVVKSSKELLDNKDVYDNLVVEYN